MSFQLFIYFTFSYLFTLKALKVTYYYTQDSNSETTVNKECENCMKQALYNFEF